MSALNALRILDLSNGVAGEYCAKLMADFGAEVIKIEPPVVGSDTRHLGPFGPAGGGVERSGLFAYLNTNKQSVVIDPRRTADRESLSRLVAEADAVIDDHPPGYLESLGLLDGGCAAHPELIICAITAFGYDAPSVMRRAYSLNVLHSSWGFHSPADADARKPPLTGAGGFLPDYESGLSAAVALMAALVCRQAGGAAQFIDVSQRDSMASLVDYVLGQMVAGSMEVSSRRQAYDLGGPATFFQCADGFVYLWLSEPGHWRGMATLMGNPSWMAEFPDRWLELHVTTERIARCRAGIAVWMKSQSKCVVADRAQKLGVPLVPVNSMDDVQRSAQMKFRGYFVDVEHPILGRLQHPTVPYRLSETPARILRPAPLLGADTDAVIKRAHAREPRSRAPGEGVRASTQPRRRGPLEGVRVIEVTKIWAGPYVGKLLALLGAEVIRVESLDSLDATRRFGTTNINDAPGFQAVNPGKCSVQLNMKHDEGRRLVQDLVKMSDIVVENLRPGAATRLGLGYETLRGLKTDIVAVSMSMYGHEGPLSYQTGYAPCFSALAGVSHLAGYSDGPPVLLNQRYGDSTYGTAAAFAALVALYHRRRTGQGQYVDVSAVESLSSMIGDSFVEYSLTGRVPERGRQHPDMAPYGCYPCADAEWISIAVRTDEEWRALCGAMDQPAMGMDGMFSTKQSRMKHARQLDELLSVWTRTHDATQLAGRLRSREVAAFKSLNSIDLVADEHLWKRGFFRHVKDSQGAEAAIVAAPWRMSVTEPTIEHAAPRLGEHNDYVLGTLLGLSLAERRRLVAADVIY